MERGRGALHKERGVGRQEIPLLEIRQMATIELESGI